ncbi:MAG: DHHA1 domain-containing protein [Desulfurococcus sp.]|nr:DHHA1 domain-containing protein [Desulfurococcus sp.]
MPRRVVLVHGDSDGVASGALARAFYSSREDVQVYFTHPVGLLRDLEEFTRNGDNIFIADIALNETHAQDVIRLLEERGLHGDVVYIDHHPEPLSFKPKEARNIVVVHETGSSASELVFRFLSEKGLNDEYSRIALYGAIGDYLDETTWVKEALRRWDKRSVYLEAGILIQSLEGSRRDYDFKREVVEYLSKNLLPSMHPQMAARSLEQAKRDEELRLWVKGNVSVHRCIGFVVNPPGSIGRAANYARIYGGAMIGAALEERGDIYVLSLRSVEPVDLNLALRMMSREHPVAGGGHPLAAGARVKKTFFTEFMDKLCETVDLLLKR